MKRVLDFDRGGREAICFSHPTMRNFPYSFSTDNIMFEHTDYGIEFANGSGRDFIDFSNEPQDSSWRVTSLKEEFFVAFELRSNPDRTQCDFEVHALDATIYLNTFRNSFPRLLPSFRFSAIGKDGEILAEKMIHNPQFLVGNKNDKKIQKLSTPLIPRFQKDPHSFQLKPMGITKSPYHLTRHSKFYTISPEFLITKEPGSHMLYKSTELLGSDSLVLETKETFSKEQLIEIKELIIQPISQIY